MFCQYLYSLIVVFFNREHKSQFSVCIRVSFINHANAGSIIALILNCLISLAVDPHNPSIIAIFVSSNHLKPFKLY